VAQPDQALDARGLTKEHLIEEAPHSDTEELAAFLDGPALSALERRRFVDYFVPHHRRLNAR
jgi:hypothetical protein